MAGFGAYGKMPSLGDFFRLGAPPLFVEPWDSWLQEGIVALRGILGDRWQACYLSAPVWRFSLGAGVAGPDVTIGVLMPSVDRVGRQFPLTLLAPVSETRSALRTHLAAGPQFELLEEIALDTLDDTMTREILAERLQSVPPVAVGSEAKINVARSDGFLALSATHASSAASVCITEMVSELALEGFDRPCIWTAVLEGGIRLVISEGLPRSRQMVALFDMDAPQWQAEEPQGAQA